MSDGFYTIYVPIVKEGNSYFEINGANSIYKDNAILKASRHSSIRNKIAHIVRVDEYREFIEWNNNNIYLKD